MLNMFSLLVVGICVLSGMVESTGIKKENCNAIKRKFNECTHAAYQDYVAAIKAGDDGRPDWKARKSCNYLTSSVEDCGNMLIGECNSEEEVTVMKDHQLQGTLGQLQSSLQEWDSVRCPAIKAHILRMRGEEDQPAEPSDVQESRLSNGSGSITLSLFLVIEVFITMFCTSS